MKLRPTNKLALSIMRDRQENPLLNTLRPLTRIEALSSDLDPMSPLSAGILRDITDASGEDGDLIPDLVAGTLRGKEDRNEILRIAKKRITEDDAGEEALEPERVMVAYRLIRELAATMGLVSPDQTLLEALQSTEFQGADGNVRFQDKWIVPQQPDMRKVNRWTEDPSWRPDRSVEQIMAAARMLADDMGFTDEVFDISTQQWITEAYRGLPLLPPPIPASATDEYDVNNPSSDPLLHLWLQAMGTLSDRLFIENGSVMMPSLGTRGLRNLLDPEHVRRLFPNRLRLVLFEAMLVEEALRVLVEHGQAKARRYLREKYGLLTHEASSILKCAKFKARQDTLGGDLDEDRALVILKLESIIHRARESCAMREELGAVKALAVVLGLAKVDTDNGLNDFTATVRRLNASKTPQMVEGSATPTQLPG